MINLIDNSIYDTPIMKMLTQGKPILKFAKVRDCAVIPKRAGMFEAGFDIYVDQSIQHIKIDPHSTKKVPTGICSIIPEGYYVQIEERGSSGSQGIKCSSGIIDSTYRGEWFLCVTNSTDNPIYIAAPDIIKNSTFPEGAIVYPTNKALFQGILHKTHAEIEIEECDKEEVNNDTTYRGDGSLGSSDQ